MMAGFSLAALTVLELAPPEVIDVAVRCGYARRNVFTTGNCAMALLSV
jgi:hypothetical protein